VWASPHKPLLKAPLSQTPGGLQFRPVTGLGGYYPYLRLTSTLLGQCSGQGAGRVYLL